MNRFNRLLSLLQRIANQSHAAEFAGDEDARHIGFELRAHHRYFHAAPRRAEHQRDCFGGTSRFACTVPDAVGRTHELRASTDDAQHMMQRLLGARLHARAATDAARGIDDGMQRNWIDESGGLRGLVRFLADALQVQAATQIPPHQQNERYAVDEIGE
jgi:hypothetical protein